MQESWGLAGGGGEGRVNSSRSCGGRGRASGGCGAGGVTVAQEASWGGSIWVLLVKGSLGILAVGCTVVQVGAAAERRGNLSGEHQSGLHKCLWVDILLGQPAYRQKKREVKTPEQGNPWT